MKKSELKTIERIIKCDVYNKISEKVKAYYIIVYNNSERCLVCTKSVAGEDVRKNRIVFIERADMDKSVVNDVVEYINRVYYDNIEDGLVRSVTKHISIDSYNELMHVEIFSETEKIYKIYKKEEKQIHWSFNTNGLNNNEDIKMFLNDITYDLYKVYYLDLKTKKVVFDYYNSQNGKLGLPDMTIDDYYEDKDEINSIIRYLSLRIRENDKKFIIRKRYVLLYSIPMETYI